MSQPAGQLKREIGLFHAVMLGLGSILGTGVFVSIGIATGIAGPAVLGAIVLAAMLALCNGLSSAQLAAAHPVAGGTYEYGYKYLNDKLGFIAGWMFLCAKSASAATAAMGVIGYLSVFFTRGLWESIPHKYENTFIAATFICVVFSVTGIVLLGIRRSSMVNSALVSLTLAGLISLCLFVFTVEIDEMRLDAVFERDHRFFMDGWQVLLPATALMFVAFTGYGRIATLGEEVRFPRKTIPVAIITTLCISVVLYLSVGYALLLAGTGFGPDYAEGDVFCPLLNAVMVTYYDPMLYHFVTIAAITAMLGVLLNLILGLSRVVLAMVRRGDLPRVFAKVNASGTTPVPAVLLVAGVIALLTLIGDVKATWSFAAFTVLIYYGITNLACLGLPKEARLYPRAFAWAGLVGCLFLAWWVEPRYWIAGVVVIVMGLFWQAWAQRYLKKQPDPRYFCADCGYDLRASKEVCPECGCAIPDGDAVMV